MTDLSEALSTSLSNQPPTFIKAATKTALFPQFISPERENIRLHQLFIKRNYSKCKSIIEVGFNFLHCQCYLFINQF